MDTQWLRNHVDELKKHLTHFKQMQHQLEDRYLQSQQCLTDPDLKSILMEQYNHHVDRQQKAVKAMDELYQKACDQLNKLEAMQA